MGEGGELLANLAGAVERVDKLTTVVPLNARYAGSVGDVVVGRVREVQAKRWRVDVCGRQDAVLHLSAVALADGAQRRRTHEDQLSMRAYFSEDDLISAEVHSVFADGSLALHARSAKYGRLEGGQLVRVPPGAVKRLPQHFVTLSCGVSVILGLNGYVWIAAPRVDGGAGAGAGAGADAAGADDTDAPPADDAEARVRVSRVRACILQLGQAGASIDVAAIESALAAAAAAAAAAAR